MNGKIKEKHVSLIVFSPCMSTQQPSSALSFVYQQARYSRFSSFFFSLPHVTQSLKSQPKQGRNEKSMELGTVSRKYLNVSSVKNKKYDFPLVTYILCLYPLIPTKEPLHQQSPSQELPHVLPSFAKATRRTTLARAIRTSGLT